MKVDNTCEGKVLITHKKNIPEYLLEIKKEDIPLLACRTMQEANFLYHVPVILGRTPLNTCSVKSETSPRPIKEVNL